MRPSPSLLPVLALGGCVLVVGPPVDTAPGCPTGQVTFTPESGPPDDLTTTFAAGSEGAPANYTLDRVGTVTFCPGTYYAQITITADGATLTGAGLDQSILSGSDGNQIVHHEGTGELTLNGLGFEHGSASDGGAVLSDSGDVTVTSCAFDQNLATGRGGALAALGGAIDASGSTFANNEADGFGGAIYVSGALTLSDDVLDSNRCVNSSSCAGGAVHAAPGSDGVSLSGVTISKSTSRNVGGGLWAQGRDVTVTGSTFTDNRSETQGGGGMVVNSGTVHLTGTVFQNNQAPSADGGAAYFTATDVTCQKAGGTGGFFSNGPGVFFVALGHTFTSVGCDWGTDTQDNVGYDISVTDGSGGVTPYSSFGDNASFTCDGTSCTTR